MTVSGFDPATYQRVLGDEIRRTRKKRGYTRKDLNARLLTDISLQTLATYELGTRQASAVRVADISIALGEMPHVLLARVDGRVFLDRPTTGIILNLREVAETHQDALYPLKRWARNLVDVDRARETHLDQAAILRLAELCRMTPDELVARLSRIPGTVVLTTEIPLDPQ